MADTHINAYVQEVETAYKDAIAAVDTLKKAIDNVRDKYHEIAGDLIPLDQTVIPGDTRAPQEVTPADTASAAASDPATSSTDTKAAKKKSKSTS